MYARAINCKVQCSSLGTIAKFTASRAHAELAAQTAVQTRAIVPAHCYSTCNSKVKKQTYQLIMILPL